MTVGSVRGKQRLEMPLRVTQGGRSDAACAFEESLGGQVRLKPALIDIVLWPQAAQNGLRKFQSVSWRASA